MIGVEVAGVGIHPFGRHGDKTATEMGVEAVRAALEEAGVSGVGFQAAFCGTAYGGVASGHKVLGALGLTGGLIRSSLFDPWQEAAGLTPAPAYFALRAQRLMHDSGVDKGHLAAVVVKNRRHGVANPDAMFRSEVTVDEVLASRVVCEPLHLWMLCSPNEGAAAVVLRRGDGGIQLRAAALRSHLPGYVLNEGTPMSGLIDAAPDTPSTLAAKAAYEQAGIGPGDLDVVECQDTDAARELLAYEELMLCGPGECGRLLSDGATRLGGRLPVNPSGGLLSKGEPLGASALGQVVELVRQLRGGAGQRQVEGARVALAHTVGRGANASAVVLAR
jgi:acetyl-CoA acetyltransferase